MIFKKAKDDELYDFIEKLADFIEENFDDEENSPRLGDGIFFTEELPIIVTDEDVATIDTEKDFFADPYQTDTLFIFKGKKPSRIEYEGQANHGANLSFKVDRPGFITVCMEDD